jgi:hypothetical protein
LLVLVFVCLVVPMYAGAGKIDKKARKIPNHYLVQLDDALQPDAKKISKELTDKHGIRILSVWEDALRGFAMETTEKIAEKIAADPRVLLVEEDQEIDLDCLGDCRWKQTSSRCADGKVPWQLDRIDQRALPLDNLYVSCAMGHGEGVKAYVIDTGVVAAHNDFWDSNQVSRVIQGRNFTSVGGIYDTNDCVAHGTAVASVLAGDTGGVAKRATIVPVKVKDCNDGGSNQKLTDGINWVAADHVAGDPAVANISILAAGTSTLVDNAVTALVTDGVFVSLGAGNNNTNACNVSPARVSSAMTVGATTKTDAKASLSNHGSCVSMWAPGENIGSAQYNSLCCLNCSPGWGLTSMAAPAAAGVAAVIYQQNYWWTPAQIKAEMIAKATTNVITGLPSGNNNRLLFANEPLWCGPVDLCYSPPPCDPES